MLCSTEVSKALRSSLQCCVLVVKRLDLVLKRFCVLWSTECNPVFLCAEYYCTFVEANLYVDGRCSFVLWSTEFFVFSLRLHSRLRRGIERR